MTTRILKEIVQGSNNTAQVEFLWTCLMIPQTHEMTVEICDCDTVFYFVYGSNVEAIGRLQSLNDFNARRHSIYKFKHCIANNVSFTNQKQIALHLMEHPLVTNIQPTIDP